MRRLTASCSALLLLAATLALGPLVADAKQEAKKGKVHTVEMLDNEFKPKELTIAVGDSVVWVNKGKKTHTATSKDDGKTFDTKNVKKGEKSKPVKFEKAGKFEYICKPHEDHDMKGTIIVK